MLIEILGTGCRKCTALGDNVQAALDGAGLSATVEKVTDIVEIAGRGVMSTPGLVIDGRVVSSGRVPDAEEIARFLRTP